MKRISVVFLALLMAATVASAPARRRPRSDARPRGRSRRAGGNAIVGSDGTIYLSTETVDTTRTPKRRRSPPSVRPARWPGR